MPVGVGAGVSLGSATVYLFADASGMRRGLQQAERETDRYIQREQQKQGAIAKLGTAKTARDIFTLASQQASSQKFIDLQRKAADSAANSTAVINAEYTKRNDLVNRYNQIVERNKKTVIDAEAAMKAARDKATAAQAASAAALAARVNNGGNAKGFNFTKAAKEEKAALEAATKATLAYERAKSSTAKANIRAAEIVASSTVASLGREDAAIKKMQVSLARHAQSYREIADIAGPKYQQFAAKIESAGNRIVTTSQNLVNAKLKEQNALNALQGAVKKEGEGYNKLVRDAEAATRAADSANAARRRAIQARAAAERQFTNQLARETDLRIKAVEKEEQQVRAAEQRMDAARQDARRGAQDRLLSTGTVLAAAQIAAVKKVTTEWGNYEEQLRNSAAIAPELQARFGDLKSAVDDLAVELGRAPSDIAAGFGVVAQAGITNFEEALNLTTVAAKASVAGMTSVEQAVKPLIGVYNAYGDAAGDAQQVSDKLFKAVTDGVFSFEELASQLGDNLSIASSLGVELDELLASYVVLTRRSNNLAESTTQVNAVMNSFIKPSAALTAAVKAYNGETAQAFIRNRDFGEVLQFVNDQFEKNADAAGKLFPNIRAIRGVFALSADEAAEFRKELAAIDYDSANAAAEVFAFQQQGMNRQLAIAREEMRQLAISFGQTLAPGIIFLADALGKAATVFTTINEATDGIPAKLLGIATVLTIVGVAGLRAYVAIATLKKSLIELNPAFLRVGSNAMRAALGLRIFGMAAGPLAIGLTLAAAAGLVLYKRHKDQQQAAKELAVAYDTLTKSVDGLFDRPDLTKSEADALFNLNFDIQWTIDQMKLLNKAIDENTDFTLSWSKGFDESGLEIVEWVTRVDEMGNVLSTTQGTREEFNDWMGDSELATKKLTELQDNLNKVISENNLDPQAVKDFIQPLIEGIFTGDTDLQDIADGVAHVTSNLDDFKYPVEEAENAVVELGESLTNTAAFFGTAEDKADALRQGLKAMSDEALRITGVLPNLNSPIEYIQQSLGNMGDTALETIQTLDDLGHIDLSEVQRQGVDSAAAIEFWQSKIDGVNASFEASDNTISNWQRIIQRTTDVVGNQTDSFAGLQKMLDQGKVTEQEYQDIKEATIFLQERGKLAIRDEQVAMAKALPDLARFVQEHEIAADAYRLITPEARGFAEAMKDTTNQTILMTAVMLKLAAAMNPDAFDNAFLEDFTKLIIAANPEAAALLDTLGLIPETVETEFKADIDFSKAVEAADEIKEIDKLISETGQNLTSALTSGEPDLEFINKMEERLDLLQQRRFIIGEGGDPAEIKRKLAEIDSGIEDTEEAADQFDTRWQEVMDQAAMSTKDAEDSLADLVESTLEEIGAVQDFQNAYESLNKTLGLTDASMEEILLTMAELDRGVELSVDEKEALQAKKALQDVEKTIEGLESAIENNEGDMSMWQGRIDLIDGLFDVSAESMEAWKKQLDDGTISQQQYWDLIMSGDPETALSSLSDMVADESITQEEANEILEDGLWIRDRSVGGLRDEREAQLRLIPALRDAIEGHDTADATYNNLSDSQKEYIALLEQESVQTALQTALLLAQLEAQGLIDEEKLNQGIQTLADSSPEIKAFFIEVGLVEADDNEEDIEAIRNKYKDPIHVEVNVDAPPTRGGPANVRTETTGSTQVSTAEVDTTTAEADLAAFEQTAATAGTNAGASFTENVSAGIAEGVPLIDGALTVIETTELIPFAADVIPLGMNVGRNYDQAMAGAVIANLGTIRAATTNLSGVFTAPGSWAYSAGYYVGGRFDAGIADAINNGTLATTAAAALGTRVYNALKQSLEVSSPSKKGYFLGKMFVVGVGNAIDSEGKNAIDKTQRVAQGMIDTFDATMSKRGVAGFAAGAPMGNRALSQSAFPTVNGVASNQTSNVTGNVFVFPLKSDEYAAMIDGIQKGKDAHSFTSSVIPAHKKVMG